MRGASDYNLDDGNKWVFKVRNYGRTFDEVYILDLLIMELIF
ncbi:hypothetical protein FHU14_000421 [Mesorhizobium sp. RMAD-H1]|nr:hypothetical protein [Mesorhizobium sp. RMAD-H1]